MEQNAPNEQVKFMLMSKRNMAECWIQYCNVTYDSKVKSAALGCSLS